MKRRARLMARSVINTILGNAAAATAANIADDWREIYSNTASNVYPVHTV